MTNQTWTDCGQGTLAHPQSGANITTEVVELKDFGRIFEVYHYGNEPEQAQRMILAAPDLLNALELSIASLNRLANTPALEASIQGTLDVARKAIIKAGGNP